MAPDRRAALAAILGDLRDAAAALAFMAGVACIGLALSAWRAEAAQAMSCAAATAIERDAAWREGYAIGLAAGLALGVAALLVLTLVAQRNARRRAYPFDDAAATADHPDVAAAIEASARKRSSIIHVLAPLGVLACVAGMIVVWLPDFV